MEETPMETLAREYCLDEEDVVELTRYIKSTGDEVEDLSLAELFQALGDWCIDVYKGKW